MAAGACQMTSPKAAQSYRVALDHLPVRGGCRTAVSCASLGARCEAVATLGARLRVTGGHRWRHKSSSIPKFFVSAAVEEAVSASQADSGALAESLSMFFKAEGSLNENAIPKLTKTLEGTEGVSQVKVYVVEGAATVELVKQTNIQETGVASSLVQLIEQAGFKMQALSLGFDDEGADDDEYIDYDVSSNTEEEATT
ncbi:uncharacterized protein [Physcomitrium patens]|uniref:Uncharacterized protein n=1 Tax=Physcomitrium patens TaxID=3218 RepID=A9RV35_PHYPA|nr:uncharacterized protein LOC112295365 [Physcomitrium patens]PNR59900.1 hypothetical protein PHYPA_002692 [Physcomitrium patens]|eukprot:XP_024402628.1 uncharacterized protein LOC112295365 [Physcomitrella patens]